MNTEVTRFLDALNHPLRKEIELLREIVLSVDAQLVENIKWNGPNYSIGNLDRITIKIQPPKCIQLILHCGAKKQDLSARPIRSGFEDLLDWKSNDRAVITFFHADEIQLRKAQLILAVKEWLLSTTE